MFKQALMRSAKQALKALVRQRNTQVPPKTELISDASIGTSLCRVSSQRRAHHLSPPR